MMVIFRHPMRRKRNRLAVEDAIFHLKKGSAQDIATEAGVLETTAIMHLRDLVESRMIRWSRPLSCKHKCYTLMLMGQQVIGARRTLQESVRHLIAGAMITSLPMQFGSIENLICAGYTERSI